MVEGPKLLNWDQTLTQPPRTASADSPESTGAKLSLAEGTKGARGTVCCNPQEPGAEMVQGAAGMMQGVPTEGPAHLFPRSGIFGTSGGTGRVTQHPGSEEGCSLPAQHPFSEASQTSEKRLRAA